MKDRKHSHPFPLRPPLKSSSSRSGIYDLDYIEYLHSLLSLMPKYGFKCFIDAHQDVWCRHTGGSGAPHWTLGVVGLDIRALKATGAAHAHNLHLLPSDPPPKVWPSGCELPFFFGGEVGWDWRQRGS